jgi:hypothetical protein
MSVEAAAEVRVRSESRVAVLDGDRMLDIFDVQSIDATLIRVRTPLLFEIGEELTLRIVDGATRDVFVRVRAHVGPHDARVTELEILPPI